MPRFIVGFLKDVLGENGQISEIRQATVELEARDNRDAGEKAKQRFCQLHATHDWSLYADRFKVDQPIFRRRAVDPPVDDTRRSILRLRSVRNR